jgi:hypothetical protein
MLKYFKQQVNVIVSPVCFGLYFASMRQPDFDGKIPMCFQDGFDLEVKIRTPNRGK